MASQRMFVWLGVLAAFAAIGGVAFLVLKGTDDEPDIDPVLPEQHAKTPEPRERNQPKIPDATPRPATPGPKSGAVADGPKTAPNPAAVADYGTIDEYRLSTVTPTFFGVVKTAQRPVAAAEVTLLEERPRPLEHKVMARVKTDPKGQFVFDPKRLRENTRYHLAVRHPDYRSRFYWNMQRGKKFDVILETGVSLAGVVVDKADKPIVGAEVLAQAKDWREIATTGDDGTFSFENAPVDPIKLTAQPKYYVPVTKDGVKAGGDDVKIAVEKGIPVAGRVIDGQTNKPIANAVVSMGVPGQDDRIPLAATDADGNYDVPGLAPTFTTFFVVAEGYSELMLPTKIKKQDAMRFDFSLFPEGKIKGRVVDAENKPVAGARLFVTSKNVFIYYVANPERPNGVSDENGNFLLTGIETNPKFDCKIVADHNDHKRGESRLVKPQPGQIVDNVVIRLPAGLRFAGRVVSKVDGKGIENATIETTSFGGQTQSTVMFGQMGGKAKTQTDAKGEFSLGKLSPGRVRVTVTAADHLKKEEMVEIAATGLTGKLFELEQGYMISGRVTDVAGKGLGNVRIHASCPHPVNSFSNGVTNQEGYFKVVNLKQGVFKLTARATGFSEQHKEGVQVGEQKADFVLQANGKLSGTVMAAGLPLKNYHVNLQKQKPDGSWRWYREIQQRDKKDGKYLLPDVEPGLYKVTIKTKDHAPSERVGVQILSGQETTDINFVLTAGASIVGKVTDAQGIVPRGAHVIAQPLDNAGKPDFTGQSRTVRIKDDGSFTIRGLKDGVFQVKAMAGGYCQGAGERVVIAAEQTYQLALIVNKGGYVTVAVRSQDGGAVSGASVFITDSAGNKHGVPPGSGAGRGKPGREVTPGGDEGVAAGMGGGFSSQTNAAGKFRIPNPICPGPATVEVSIGGVTASKQIIVVDEQEIEERIRLGR